ncbi:MAG TPA: hypothetical protein VEY09_03440 [Pyrinomonadaceae bacterium]|nr:hypothetical protein [Pyrinomonadaceae bacterium]
MKSQSLGSLLKPTLAAVALAALSALSALSALAAPVAASAGRSGADEAQRGRRPAAARRAVVKSMTLKAGEWGGSHARLVAGAGRVTVEFDCAHGHFEGPVTLDAAGRFEAAGTYVREGGGPSRVEADAPDSAPVRAEGEETFRARYAGVVEGRNMTLAVTLVGSGAEVGTFRLRLGRPAALQKCL